MRASRKTVFLTGTLAITAALLTAAQLPAQAGHVGAASDPGPAAVAPAPAPSMDKLKGALPPVSSFPAGSTVTTVTVADAVRDGQLALPPGVVVSPASCADLLTVVSGSLGRLSGWMRVGVLPTNGSAIEAGIAGTVSGGANMAALRSTVGACRSATVTSNGMTGTMSLAEFAGPVVSGAQSMGVQQTVSIGGETATGYQVYVADAAVLAVSCSIDQAEAMGTAVSIYGGATS